MATELKKNKENSENKLGKTEKTITRKQIAEAIAEKVGLSRQMSTQILEFVLDEMARGLIEAKQLKVSSFASFKVNEKNERIGRNPKTGEEKPISARKTISFKASDIFKNRVLKQK